MQSTAPEGMRVIAFDEPGSPDVLKVATRPAPRPAAGEVLIKVAAAGVNRPDILQREGAYPPPKGASDLLGLEVAGEVVALGEGAPAELSGARVAALVNGGGYAEYAAAPATQVLRIPDGVSMTDAASLPEGLFTVWHNVFERGRLASGEVLLVHGGSSGIGVTAIQMARLMGATVIATAGSAEKCAACEELGAARAVNYREEDFVEAVRAATDGRGADVILDMVGGDYIGRNIKCAAEDGRIVQIAFLKGSKAEVDFMRLMMKRLTLTGSTLRAQSAEAKARMRDRIAEAIWPHVGSGGMRPVIERVFPFEEAAGAHRHLEAGQHVGKVVLSVE
jgi:NADPH2:quinone reductase